MMDQLTTTKICSSMNNIIKQISFRATSNIRTHPSDVDITKAVKVLKFLFSYN